MGKGEDGAEGRDNGMAKKTKIWERKFNTGYCCCLLGQVSQRCSLRMLAGGHRFSACCQADAQGLNFAMENTEAGLGASLQSGSTEFPK